MSLYRGLLGDQFDHLPSAVRAFHTPEGPTVWKGRAEVTRGTGWMAQLGCWMAGFPPAGAAVPLTVTVTPSDESERWDRDFGGHVMSSHQWGKGDELIERLGLFCIRMHPKVTDGQLSVHPVGWSFLGVPLPRALMPTTENFETQTAGTFEFNVTIAAPLIGHMVSYRGFLERTDGKAA